jgi:hypothetical protein
MGLLVMIDLKVMGWDGFMADTQSEFTWFCK